MELKIENESSIPLGTYGPPCSLRLFVLPLEDFRYAKVIIVSEVPLAHREELQHVQAIGDPRLDTDHTGIVKKSTINQIFQFTNPILSLTIASVP